MNAPLLRTCLFALLCTLAQGAERRPNVVFFLVDDMGWMDCGVYGSKYYETPNIDRFAKRAMRFTDAYAQPLCSPTRASLLTGKYPSRHGITTASGHQPPQAAGHKFLPDTAPANRPMLMPESKNYLEPSEYTLAEALRDAGYRTAHIGKWHLGLMRPHWPKQQGFDVAFHCHPDPGPPGNYFSPYGVKQEGEPRGQNKVGTITDGPAGEYIVDRQADEAVRFIESSKDKPFFLNLWCYGVHGPWGHKEEYTRQFAAKSDPGGEQGNPIMASMLRSVDECFGRVIDTLDRLGLAENTIVIFNSDNGGNTHSNTPDDRKRARKAEGQLGEWTKWAGPRPPTNNAPLRDGKGTLYEGGTRVPLMWAWAGKINPGTVNATVVGHIDLYPTLLDLAGIAQPAQQKMDGVSYASVLLGKGTLGRDAFFNYFPHARNSGGVWVRSGDLKLIRWFDPAIPRELYDLHADLGETKNLADAQPDKAKQLDGLIDTFLATTGALYPRPNPGYKPTQPRITKPLAPDDGSGPIAGWKIRSMKATPTSDGVRLEGNGRTPFLGTAKYKFSGAGELRLRVKAPAGGPAQVHWRLEGENEFQPEHATQFDLTADAEWREVAVPVPSKGGVVQLRVFLPADKGPIELNRIDVSPSGAGRSQRPRRN
jgi:arylsulfatase A-like enzyme